MKRRELQVCLAQSSERVASRLAMAAGSRGRRERPGQGPRQADESAVRERHPSAHGRALRGQDGSDVHRPAYVILAGFGPVVAIVLLDGLRRTSSRQPHPLASPDGPAAARPRPGTPRAPRKPPAVCPCGPAQRSTAARPRSRTACPGSADRFASRRAAARRVPCGSAAAALDRPSRPPPPRRCGVPRWPTVSRSATSLSLCDCTNSCVHGRLKTVCRSASIAGRSSSCEPAVEQPAVVVGRGGDVERAFLAALDLEARDAGRTQRRQMIGQGQVLHREGKALCADRGAPASRRAGFSGASADLVGIAARIGALAAVAAAAERLRGEQAQAAVRVTQRAVNEDLGFDARRGGDVVHFLEGQLAGQHHAAETRAAAAPPRRPGCGPPAACWRAAPAAGKYRRSR